MLTPEEEFQIRRDVRRAVYEDLADIEERIAREAGSYNYLCLVGGEPLFCHQPVGRIIRRITPVVHTEVA